MKTWGITATLCFAVLAFGFGQAIGAGAVTVTMGADLPRAAGDGAVVAVLQAASTGDHYLPSAPLDRTQVR